MCSVIFSVSATTKSWFNREEPGGKVSQNLHTLARIVECFVFPTASSGLMCLCVQSCGHGENSHDSGHAEVDGFWCSIASWSRRSNGTTINASMRWRPGLRVLLREFSRPMWVPDHKGSAQDLQLQSHFVNRLSVADITCPVKSRIDSTGCEDRISRFRNRLSEVPVKWAFSRIELG